MTAARTFRVECMAGGAPFFWQGDATNEADAFRQAAEAMVQELPWVHAREVKQTACIEVTRPELRTFAKQLQRGSSDLSILAWAVFFVVALISTSGWLGAWFEAKGCHDRWDLSATPTRWSWSTGCMVQRPNGKWVPEATVREVRP